MQKIFTALFFMFVSTFSFASDSTPRSIDQIIADAVEPTANAISKVVFANIPGTDIIWIVAWLGIASVVCTFYFGFIQIREFKLATQILRGKFSDKEHPGEVSHFQALSAALSGTLGLGNIAGVAIAIALGGPGAAFWMVMMGFFCMATKFTECTLGVKYRHIDAQGNVSGGPMYYLKAGLTERGFPRFGKIMGVLAAVILAISAFGIGNLFQVNQATSQIMHQFQMESGAVWLGLFFGVACGVVIIGGIKKIAKVASFLVPLMVVVYMGGALVILAMHFSAIPGALALIISSAFTPDAAFGGFIGALMQGLKRASFSNEAGFGSAPIAHAAVKTKEPATEGLVALLEPFFDTVILNTITALVVVVTGSYLLKEYSGVLITTHAFNSVLPGFDIVLTISIVLFAFTTMLTWSYYGLKGWQYLFGNRGATAYKFVFCAVSIIAATMSLGSVIDLADALVFVLAFFNVLGLYFLLPIVKKEVNGFLAKVKSGEIKPNED
ncbi:alanine/glycine:cation symporter family protein [Acinetobacter puyangensis]|uniref:alanine/glycine:cation symporter family protein n=1 Tax=Acinetobacter puyangensis TaxID=1096779 RepID=UPI003A4D9AF7